MQIWISLPADHTFGKMFVMEGRLSRIVIYPKDVGRITGQSERSGRRLLQKIKKTTSKQQHQYVSISDFCNFTGLPEETIQKFMED